MKLRLIADRKRGKERFLRKFHIAHALHAFFAFFLFFKKFALTGDVAAVTFCGNVFAESGNRFPGYDFLPDSRLDGDFKKLPRYGAFEFQGEISAVIIGFVPVHDDGEGVKHI